MKRSAEAAGAPASEHPYSVALLHAGRAEDPGQWSGIPNSVTRALESLGACVLPLEAPLPVAVQRVSNRHIAIRQRMMGGMGVLLSRRLATTPGVDGVVQLGSGEQYVRTALPLVTYDDMTVAQATRVGHNAVAALGDRGTLRWRARQTRVLRAATACGTFSHWAARSVRDDYDVSAGSVVVLGWGRNHEPDPAVPRDWSVPRFLFVGGDWARKNGDAVVRAFSRLREDLPGARLDVVGGHPRLAIDGVTAHGPLRLGDRAESARLRELFATSTCFVMPSWHEPAGIVYAEAGAAGMALIGTTAGGASDMVTPACGATVDPSDDDALLVAMRRLSYGPAVAAAGAAARDRAQLFTWRTVAERLLRALGAPPWRGCPWAPFLATGE